jgi:hypothetical protein
MKQDESRQPTHNLCVTNKSRKEGFQVVGVCWQREDGSISIKLNKMVVLSWRDDDHAIYVFRRNEKPK